MTSLLADLRAQPDFRTELWSQPEAEPKSEVTHCRWSVWLPDMFLEFYTSVISVCSLMLCMYS